MIGAVIAAAAALAWIGIDGTSSPRPGATAGEQRAARTQLRELHSAWSDGGGRFGYPFWERAAQRWRRGEITDSIYREYVTGYRDRMSITCDLIGRVTVTDDPARQVKRLLADSCRARVESLRELRDALDDTISARRPADPDVAEADLDAAAQVHFVAADELLQASYRDTRLAMNIAQSTLRVAGQDRLPEDAFL